MTVSLAQKTDGLLYRVCGLTVSCNVCFPELASVAQGDLTAAADVHVTLSDRRVPLPSLLHWFMTWTLPSGEAWLSTAKIKEGYLLRFPDLADFTVDDRGRTIRCCPEPETPEETVRHLLLDQVLPLVLTLHGRHALHATAVLTPYGVCAFAGMAGAGKSTLAASFLLADYPVLCDDCLVLQEDRGQILATPAYPGLRLWEDAYEALGIDQHPPDPVAHYSSKRRLAFQDPQKTFAADLLPLAGIYFLDPPSVEAKPEPDCPLVEPLTPRDAFVELLLSMFRLDITNRAMLQQQFHFLYEVAAHVPVRRLHASQTFAALPFTRDAILRDLANG